VEASGTGISEAFNIGIRACSGDIIGILNADDWYEVDAVERSVAALDRDPSAGFTYGEVTVHGNGYKLQYGPKVKSGDLRSMAVKQMMFNHISSFVRRSVYDQYGMYDARYRVAMDFDFYARIITGGVRGIYVPGVLGHVRAGGRSSDIWVRSCDYYPITTRYIGPIRGAWSVIGFALRSAVFNIALQHRALYLLANRRGSRFTVSPNR
jgi:glycosyltransferase involved in cell wall biosynthesis